MPHQVLDQVPGLGEAMGGGPGLGQERQRAGVLLRRDEGERRGRGALRQDDAAVIAGLAHPLEIERAEPVLRGGVLGIAQDPRLEKRDRADDLRLVRRQGLRRRSLRGSRGCRGEDRGVRPPGRARRAVTDRCREEEDSEESR